MKRIRIWVTLLILAPLMNGASTTGLSSNQGTGSQVKTALNSEPIDDIGIAEPPSLAHALASSTTQSDTGEWFTECVDCPKQFSDMSHRSLRLDSADHPHVAYGRDHLYYAWHDGADWHYETVDESPGVGPNAFLVLDESDLPHIIYEDYLDLDNRNLKYAHYDGTSWHITTVGSVGSFQSTSVLALDATGVPHISYYDETNDVLKYAQYDGTSWAIQTVDSASTPHSLTLDTAGWPHIIYSGIRYGEIEGMIKRARYDGMTWHIETLGSLGTNVSNISLALDAASRPHVSYHEWNHPVDYAIKYAWHDGTTWHIQKVNVAYPCFGTSLALDTAERPHIAYNWVSSAYTANDLRYAWYDGTSWHIETVHWEGSGGWYPSLTLDAANQPHISYQMAYDDLKYARLDGTSWHIQTVESWGIVGSHNSLALDGANQPHIGHYDATNHDLKYAWHDGTSWYTETVESQGAVGMHTSLALDGADRPHIGYYDEINGDLKYAWHDGTSWYTETVESQGVVGTHTSLALDGVDQPHIGYYDATNLDLKHAWHDGTTWYTETVDHIGSRYDESGHISLALDQADRPHISYYDSIDNDLQYARHDGTTWYTETVDSMGYCSGHCIYGDNNATALALDQTNHPHISYYDLSNRELRYAWHDGTSWYTQTVDSQGDVGGDLSLALDEMGRPHISYVHSRCFDYASLMYARYDGQNWHIETLDRIGCYGGYTSLALDHADRPHISYYHARNGDLQYAWWVPPLHLGKQATPSDGLRNNQTLTYTLTLSGSGLSARLWDPLPPSVHYVTDTLTGTVSPPTVYSPTAHAVVWQGTLPTDTVGVVRFQVTRGITGAGSLDLSAPIANRAWLTDTHSGQGVSATAIVNAQRVYLPLTLRSD